MSGASWKIQSSTSQITRLGWRAKAAASTKACSRELEPLNASFSDFTPSIRSMSLWRKWIASEVPINTVSKSWLWITPASCRRLSGEYIAAQKARGPEHLQRIDDVIEPGRSGYNDKTRTDEPDQIAGWIAYLFEHDLVG